MVASAAGPVTVVRAVEQFMNTDRLVGMGVARRIDTPEATVGTLRAALNDLVTAAQVARRSALLRVGTQAEGGTPRAADLVEDMLA
ncbi:hypothetical protein ACGF5C_24355 [Micromonospora sp. NPDC047620]|uniref:hypothetical protein n=1 Tax=Micromonospora sp. NPDC047620 TaxID=3364251 RepID=UPI00371093F1